MKKKLMSLLVAAAMVVTMTSTVFASSASPSANGTVSSTSAATDADGNAITVTLSTNFTAEQQAAVDTLKTTDGLKAALGSDYNANMTVLDVKDVTVPAGTKFPATITFNVAGVTSASKGVFLHYTNGAWEKIAATFGNGTMKGTFNSLSPVAFVIDKTTASTSNSGNTTTTTSGTTSTTTSPKTAESDRALAAAGIAILAVAAAVTVRRKHA